MQPTKLPFRSSRWPPHWMATAALMAIVLSWPWIGWGALQALNRLENRVEDWLPAQLPETQELIRFVEQFGSDAFLMVSWYGCQIGDPRADLLADLLLAPHSDGDSFFAEAQSGTQLLQLMQEQWGLTEPQALSRMKSLFIGPDLNHTCVIARVSDYGMINRSGAVQYAKLAAGKATGLLDEEIYLAGTTVDSVAVQEASNQFLVELNAISWAVCLLILFFVLKSFWLSVFLFLIGIYNQQLAMAVIHYSGGQVDSIQLLVANLAFVLTISFGLHYLGYYREVLATGQPTASLVAFRHARLPTLLAVITTSLGFISLTSSTLVPIRSFGLYSAVVVPTVATIVVILLTIGLGRFAARSVTIGSAGKIGYGRGGFSGGAFINRWWLSLPLASISKRPASVIIIWLLCVIGCGLGVKDLSTSVGTQQLLDPQDKLVRDYAWLESNIGALVPIELVIYFPKTQEQAPSDTLRQIQLLDRLRRRFQKLPQIESTFSVLNFLPNLPRGSGLRDVNRRAVIGKLTHDSRQLLDEMGLYYSGLDEQAWRISGRVAGSVPTDYGILLADIHQMIEDFNVELLVDSNSGSQAEKNVSADSIENKLYVSVSGGIPFIYQTQERMLSDMLRSFTTAFIMIGACMALIFRNVGAGLLTMLPNITPAALVFGFAGWTGLSVEIGAVLTASVMMGVCVDNTLHLSIRFRRLVDDGLDQRSALRRALNDCGAAMVQTGLVCGLGMMVFGMSAFIPVSRFGLLTFALLMIGMFSDLFLTTAILLSPMYRFFCPRTKSRRRMSM